MGMIEDGGDTKVKPDAPLFASSWLALFLLLRQQLENFRDGDAAAEAGSERPAKSPRPH